MKNRLLALLLLLSSNIALGQFSQAQRQEFRDANLLSPFNPGFENGKQSWTNASGTFALTTSASLLGAGTTSAQWTAAGSGNTLTSKSVTVTAGLFGAACQASILHKGGDANVVLEAFDVTTSLALGQLTLAASTNYALDVISFTCPTAADSINLRLRATAASALFDIDSAFLGAPAFNGVVATSPTAFTEAKTVVGSVGSSGQIVAGHLLTTTEWPFTVASTLAYWNFDSSATTDGSGGLACTSAACTLTNSGTPVAITGTDIFGVSSKAANFVAASSEVLTQTDQFLNPPNSTSYSTGGWFCSVGAWTGQGAGISLIGQWPSNADRGWNITLTGGTTLSFQGTNSAGASDAALNVTVALGSGCHHFAQVYSFSTTTLKGYLDGKLVASGPLANQRATTGHSFSLGKDGNVVQYFNGAANAVFFARAAMTDDDIHKVYAYSWAHNRNIAAANQWLTGNWYRSDSLVANQLTSAWVVHKDTNTLYTDFSDLASGAFIDFKLSNSGTTPTSLPVNSYDSAWLSTTPATTLAHGLGALPSAVQLQYESATPSAGNYQLLTAGDYCSYDATNFYCDWDTLTIDSTHLIRLQAWLPGAVAAVQSASATNSGLVNTTRQSIAGPKVAVDGVSAASNVRASEGAGTTTLTDADNRWQRFNLSAARTMKLPSTGVVAGEHWYIENPNAFDLTIQASDGTTLATPYPSTIQNGIIQVVANVAAPTTNTQWTVVYVYEEYQYTAVCSGAITTTANVNLIRTNKTVSMRVDAPSATAVAGISITLAATNNPSRIRPASGSKYAGTVVQHAGANVSGMAFVNSDGTIVFRKFDQSNFTGTTSISVAPDASVFTYTI